MWNDRITPEGVDRQLDEMLSLGIRRFYILPMPKSFRPTSFPTPLEPSYLSKGYFDIYRYAISRAKEKGMTAWLYDEGGWPSGSACGQVMLEDPSLVQETVRTVDILLPKGTPYLPSDGCEIAFLGEKEVRSGDSFPLEITITEYRRVRTSFPHVSSADIPDVTKRGATDLFLKLTHDRYQSALGDLPKAGVTALFTDEPTAPRPFPYTEEVKVAFQTRFGERIEPYLPLLMGKVKPNEKTAKIKIEFFRMMSDLFCERVLKKEREWAHQAGVLFLGHLDKDDEANGSMTGGSFGLLPALRCFDIPGVDAIRRQIFPPKGRKGLYGENKFFLRLASSAAAQSGGRHALTESFAVYGGGLSYDEMRFVLNFQAMRGINLFNMMIFPYGREGYLQAGLLPHFTADLYPDLKIFNEYLSRLSYLFSLGERVADTALYDPIEDGITEGADSLTAYEDTGRALEKRGILFDVIDDDFLLGADPDLLRRGVFAMGKAAYRTVILPDCKHLSDRGVEALHAFLSHGGNVLTTSKSLADKLGATYCPDVDSIPSPRPVDDGDISYAESVTSEGRLRFLMNESGKRKRLTLPVEGSAPYLIRPTEGEVFTLEPSDDKIILDIESGEILALLYSDRTIESTRIFTPSEKAPLGKWRCRAIERLVIGETTRRLPLSEKEKPLDRDPFAPDFSGSVLYQTTFSLPTGCKRAALDLGEVACVAEVTVNGVSLGKKVMSPYRFDIPLSLLKKENTLCVTVTNTPAREYLHTDAFDSFRPWQLGNYFKEEQSFHAESLESGLLGEVSILYE